LYNLYALKQLYYYALKSIFKYAINLNLIEPMLFNFCITSIIISLIPGFFCKIVQHLKEKILVYIKPWIAKNWMSYDEYKFIDFVIK